MFWQLNHLDSSNQKVTSMTEETHPRNTPLNKDGHGAETNLSKSTKLCTVMSCKSQKKNLKSLKDFDDLLLSQKLLYKMSNPGSFKYALMYNWDGENYIMVSLLQTINTFLSRYSGPMNVQNGVQFTFFPINFIYFISNYLHSLTGNSWKSLMSSIRILRSLILSAKPAAM